MGKQNNLRTAQTSLYADYLLALPAYLFQFIKCPPQKMAPPTHPPINTRDTFQKNDPARTNPLPSFMWFCSGQFTSAIFHFMWTNSGTQTNKQSIYLDMYGTGTTWLRAGVLVQWLWVEAHDPKVVSLNPSTVCWMDIFSHTYLL